MGNLVSKLKDLILRHKILSMICLLSAVAIIIMLYIFCSIFVGGDNKYGNRLDGIKEVEIKNAEITKIEKEIQKNNEVDSADVRMEGKIVYIDIIFTNETSKDKAKEIATNSLKNFNKEKQEYYDFEYILTQVGKGDDLGFAITGTKSPKIDKISWIKS